MSAPKGWPSQTKLDRLTGQFATVEQVRDSQFGLSVLAHQTVYEVGTDAVEANSTVSAIVATAHAALAGDVIKFTSGALSGKEVKAYSVSANEIVLAEDLSVAPSAADTFSIRRHVYPKASSDGVLAVSASVTPGPIAFVLDSVDTEVEEDTGTPANSNPLPIKILNGSGDEAGTATDPLRVDPTGTTPQPASQSGTWNINNVSGTVSLPTGAATEATLANIDSNLLIADTDNVTISAPLPAGTNNIGDVDVLSLPAITAVDLDIRDLSSVQDSVAAVQSGTWNVNNVSGTVSLPTGAATEATLSSLDGNVIKADTDNVIITGALPAGSNNIGDVDVLSLPSIPAGTNNIGDVDVLSSVHPVGMSVVTTVRNDYGSVNVTAGAWVQLVASLGSTVKELEIFDSSGETLEIGIGAAASETRLILVFPGGNGRVPVAIASGTRVSIRAVSATANVGEIDINFYG